MYRCAEDVVFDKEKIRDILEEAADRFSLKELALYATENDEGDDFCFVMLCTNGHLFLHVFPTYGYVEADIFTLESGANPEQVAVFLRQEFGPDQSKLTTLKRGDYGSIKDMKPQRKKMVKTMRRATPKNRTENKRLSLAPLVFDNQRKNNHEIHLLGY